MAGRWSRRCVGVVLAVGLLVVTACAPTASRAVESGDSSVGVAVDSPSAVDSPMAAGDPTTVSAGGTHTCEVITGGTVKCWGRNNYGQLGNKTNTNANTPLTVVGVSGVTKLSAGYTHTCVIVAAGAVKCWGANTYGELGNNSLTNSNAAVTVSGVTGATAISAGYYHTCAIVAGGAVKCWGQNKSGQLGNNSIVNAKTAVSVSGITGATALSASGVAHTCAVVAGGAIKCWGNNTYGQLGNKTKVSSRVPVSVFGTTGATAVSLGGYHSCVIVSGFAKCWGNNTYGQLGTASNTSSTNAATVAGISGATQISSFYRHTCALISGAVKCWGYNLYGQLGVGNSTDTNAPVTMSGVSGATVLTAGANFTCAMVTGAVVKCTGQNSFGQLGNATFTTATSPVTVSATTGASNVVTGGSHACAIVDGGAVKCSGTNGGGALGNGSTAPSTVPVTAIGVSGASVVRLGFSVYGAYTCAIVTAGAVRCWGGNESGQLGNGTTNNAATPTSVTGVTGAVDLTMGASLNGPTTCALLGSGSVKCWGMGAGGQLGNGSTSGSATAVTVSGISDATALVAGIHPYGAHSCAIVTSGAVKCWGYNAHGQVGNGSFVDATTPALVSGVTGATQLVTGGGPNGSFTCALVAAGAVKCWGGNIDGGLGNGSNISSSTAVSVAGVSGATQIVSEFFNSGGGACALVAGGAVKCWGYNGQGQLGNGTVGSSNTPVNVTGLTGASSIAGNGGINCAIVAGGAAKCWGTAPLGNGSVNNSSVPVSVSGLTGITKIAMSFNSPNPCAVIANGVLKCWGYNTSGQIGNGTMVQALNPSTVLGIT